MNFKTIIFLLLFGMLMIPVCIKANENDAGWLSSYPKLRKMFKSLSSSEEVYCEGLLRSILSDLDNKNQCSTDENCILIDKPPFGITVPIPKTLEKDVSEKMTEYGKRCDGGYSHLMRHDDLYFIPVCFDGKCMVKTGIKKKAN